MVPGTPFAEPERTIRRADGITLSWTTDEAAAPKDQVILNLHSPNAGPTTMAGLSTRMLCVFPASAGSGLVPSAALSALSPGLGRYDLHSKQYRQEIVPSADGTPWKLGFNVSAHARTADGLAYGRVTVE
jgi:hypothetical protein